MTLISQECGSAPQLLYRFRYQNDELGAGAKELEFYELAGVASRSLGRARVFQKYSVVLHFGVEKMAASILIGFR